jgi:UDP:flavonoid glycosyltransferase YjiC (YdhE family)
MRVITFWALLSLAAASKILIISNQESSHIRAMANVGRPLAERGHQVTIPVLYSQKQGPAVIGKMEQLLWGDPKEEVYFSNKPEISAQFLRYYRESFFFESLVYSTFEWPKVLCDYLLKDEKLYDTVKTRKFDLVIVDGLVITRCNYIFVHNLGVPYVSLTAIFPFDIGLISQYFHSPFTVCTQFLPPDLYLNTDVGKQTFLQRTGHAIFMIATQLLIQYQIYDQYNMYKNYSFDPLTKSLTQLAMESKLWLIEQNPVLDFPRATYGNLKFIGGTNWKPAKPLPEKYAKIVSGATGGFVVVSLGADLLYMPKDLGDILANAFKKIPSYKFIWANRGELTQPIPENIITVDWMPQNDLIGHKNCKLFITHCGNNGQFEAVGHGVPMLGIPIHRDQPSNAWRMIDKGFGLAIHLNSVSVEEIVDKIKKITENPKYKDNIMKASAVFHAAPLTPKQQAVYWVEHVLTHGTDYLKSDAMEMPWYQVLGYDIIAFFVLGIILLISLVQFVRLLIRNKQGKIKSKSD